MDAKIEQLTKKRELLKQYKKGVMQQLFPSAASASASSAPALRFKIEGPGGELVEPPDWEEKKLGEVSNINPSNKALPENFIYIDLESVENGMLIKENGLNKTESPSRAQRVLEKNDILFQTVRPYQMNNLFFEKEGTYVASTGYAQIRAKQNPKYLYHYFHYHQFVNEVIKRCTGTSYPAISSNDLSEILISMPCESEQTKIANFLSSIDAKLAAVAELAEATQQFKKGLLQQMFV